jgi:hypothetical protein
MMARARQTRTRATTMARPVTSWKPGDRREPRVVIRLKSAGAPWGANARSDARRLMRVCGAAAARPATAVRSARSGCASALKAACRWPLGVQALAPCQIWSLCLLKTPPGPARWPPHVFLRG